MINLSDLKAFLPSAINADLRLLVSQSSDPLSVSIYSDFEVDSVSFDSHGKSIHGRTLVEKALQQVEEIKIVLIRRSKSARVESIANLSPPEPSKSAPLIKPKFEEILAAYRSAASGREFVALKWFRDTWIPQQSYAWARDPETVMVILKSAIEEGVLRKEQLPNPNNPNHPTTTLREGNGSLSGGGVREHSSIGARRNFSPISIQGKPLSATVLDGR